jgi:ligand-binding SRPBCC domain-containing protein
VDVQVRGPYLLWHHTHRFVEEGSGTRITDEVLYQLPFGPLGELAHWALVRRDVEKIFDYREAKVRSLFA